MLGAVWNHRGLRSDIWSSSLDDVTVASPPSNIEVNCKPEMDSVPQVDRIEDEQPVLAVTSAIAMCADNMCGSMPKRASAPTNSAVGVDCVEGLAHRASWRIPQPIAAPRHYILKAGHDKRDSPHGFKAACSEANPRPKKSRRIIGAEIEAESTASELTRLRSQLEESLADKARLEVELDNALHAASLEKARADAAVTETCSHISCFAGCEAQFLGDQAGPGERKWWPMNPNASVVLLSKYAEYMSKAGASKVTIRVAEFFYEVDFVKMTQRNLATFRTRPFRFVLNVPEHWALRDQAILHEQLIRPLVPATVASDFDCVFYGGFRPGRTVYLVKALLAAGEYWSRGSRGVVLRCGKSLGTLAVSFDWRAPVDVGICDLSTIPRPEFFKFVHDTRIVNDIFRLLQESVYHHHPLPPGQSGCPSDFTIRCVWHVENWTLWQRYLSAKRHMREDLRSHGLSVRHIEPPLGAALASFSCEYDLDQEVNEVFLFHGTSSVLADDIGHDGFDFRLAGPGFPARFGFGTYFAAQSCKCLQYGATVLLSRVLLGDPETVSYVAADAPKLEATRRPPFRKGTSRLADSIIARPTAEQVHQEFIVFDRNQAYPEYWIDIQWERQE